MFGLRPDNCDFLLDLNFLDWLDNRLAYWLLLLLLLLWLLLLLGLCLGMNLISGGNFADFCVVRILPGFRDTSNLLPGIVDVHHLFADCFVDADRDLNLLTCELDRFCESTLSIEIGEPQVDSVDDFLAKEELLLFVPDDQVSFPDLLDERPLVRIGELVVELESVLVYVEPALNLWTVVF